MLVKLAATPTNALLFHSIPPAHPLVPKPTVQLVTIVTPLLSMPGTPSAGVPEHKFTADYCYLCAGAHLQDLVIMAVILCTCLMQHMPSGLIAAQNPTPKLLTIHRTRGFPCRTMVQPVSLYCCPWGQAWGGGGSKWYTHSYKPSGTSTQVELQAPLQKGPMI
jgi:hypothetical protein